MSLFSDKAPVSVVETGSGLEDSMKNKTAKFLFSVDDASRGTRQPPAGSATPRRQPVSQMETPDRKFGSLALFSACDDILLTVLSRTFLSSVFQQI